MISTRGRYALRVMIDLAEHRFQWLIPLKDIAERQEISKKYLELLVRDLVAAQLIIGVSDVDAQVRRDKTFLRQMDREQDGKPEKG